MISCACGCNTLINPTDKRGRVVHYLHGHSNRGKHLSLETKNRIGIKNKIKSDSEIERVRKLALDRIGIGLTDEHKKKISLKCKGLIPWNKGKAITYTPEVLIKKRELFSGSNNPRWSGGIYPKIYSEEFNPRFKRMILNRDGNRCMLCTNSLARIHIHHIDLNPMNTVIENCISLCISCHNQVHTNTNENEIKYLSLFQNILRDRYGYQYPEVKILVCR